MSLELASAAGLGFLLGFITGMPLGVVNVAIVDAATRGRGRFALGVGLGGALADTVHAAIAFVGVGRLVTEHEAASRMLAIVAAAIVVGYAVIAWRGHTAPPHQTRRRGVLTGIALTLPNPAALGAWVAVAATLWPAIAVVPALVLAAGVGIGSALWFTLLARWVARLPADHRAVRFIPKAALVVLVAIAVVGVVRTLS